MNKCWIAILEKEKPIKKYAATTLEDGAIVKITIKTKTKTITKKYNSIQGKPAMRIALEAVMLRYKDYDPQKHRVTVLPRKKTT